MDRTKHFTMTQTTLEKAEELNLDPLIYGTFAEIGAGQETGNFFFRASGTAGLVAKTISAYDMTMSDAIYGHAERYVSDSNLAIHHQVSFCIPPVRASKEVRGISVR
jgi:hypothetical protein